MRYYRVWRIDLDRMFNRSINQSLVSISCLANIIEFSYSWTSSSALLHCIVGWWFFFAFFLVAFDLDNFTWKTLIYIRMKRKMEKKMLWIYVKSMSSDTSIGFCCTLPVSVGGKCYRDYLSKLKENGKSIIFNRDLIFNLQRKFN